MHPFGKVTIFLVPFLAAEGVIAETNLWQRSLTVALAQQGGNTDLISFSGALSAEYAGDLQIGGKSLEDSEVKLALSHNRGELSNALYQHDGSASFLLDVMAQQEFSPFFLSYWSYDSTTSLNRRVQLGAGGKYRFGGGISISIAYLWEVEDYRSEPEGFHYRWSIRPKYKRTFDNGVKVQYIVFLQPLVLNLDNYLVESKFTLSIPTMSEKLKITATWTDKHNSRPPEGVKKRDTDINLGFTFSF